MTRLMENTETSVNWVMTHSTKKAPKVAAAPTTIGSTAATTPRKTNSSSSSVSGIAISSASARSFSRFVPSASPMAAAPPTSTVSAPRSPPSRSRTR